MLTALLTRCRTSDEGTFGTLELEGNYFQSGELPARHNIPDYSCIPAGEYTCTLCFSPHFERNLYLVQGVPGRSNVRIHTGNWCGDATKGMKCDVEGCILLGQTVGQLEGQEAVIDSMWAVTHFMGLLGGQDFTLKIVESYA